MRFQLPKVRLTNLRFAWVNDLQPAALHLNRISNRRPMSGDQLFTAYGIDRPAAFSSAQSIMRGRPKPHDATWAASVSILAVHLTF